MMTKEWDLTHTLMYTQIYTQRREIIHIIITYTVKHTKEKENSYRHTNYSHTLTSYTHSYTLPHTNVRQRSYTQISIHVHMSHSCNNSHS